MYENTCPACSPENGPRPLGKRGRSLHARAAGAMRFMYETALVSFPVRPGPVRPWLQLLPFRHWERRFALTLEYGAEGRLCRADGWALVSWAATSAPCAPSPAPSPAACRSTRSRPVVRSGTLIAPRRRAHAQFTDLTVSRTRSALRNRRTRPSVTLPPDGAARGADGDPAPRRPAGCGCRERLRAPAAHSLAAGGTVDMLYDY